MASSCGRQPNFAALNRGRHLYSAGRPSRWALADISSFYCVAGTNVISLRTAQNSSDNVRSLPIIINQTSSIGCEVTQYVRLQLFSEMTAEHYSWSHRALTTKPRLSPRQRSQPQRLHYINSWNWFLSPRVLPLNRVTIFSHEAGSIFMIAYGTKMTCMPLNKLYNAARKESTNDLNVSRTTRHFNRYRRTQHIYTIVYFTELIYSVKVLHCTRHKTGNFGDGLRSQSLGVVLKKLNLTQQKQTTQEQNNHKNIQNKPVGF